MGELWLVRLGGVGGGVSKGLDRVVGISGHGWATYAVPPNSGLGVVQCHSTIGPRPIDRTVLTAESSGARSWELGSGEL